MNDETKKKINERYEHELNRGERFWPDSIFKDLIVSLGIFILLIVLATFIGVANEPKADPSDSSYLPRPGMVFSIPLQVPRPLWTDPGHRQDRVAGDGRHSFHWDRASDSSSPAGKIPPPPLFPPHLFPGHHGHRRPGYCAADGDGCPAGASERRGAGRIHDPASHRRSVDPCGGAGRADRTVRVPAGLRIGSRPGAACRSWSRSSALLRWSP